MSRKQRRITIPNRPGVAGALAAAATSLEVADNALEVADKIHAAHSAAIEQLIAHGLVSAGDVKQLRENCAATKANIEVMRRVLDPLRRRLSL